MRRLRIMVGFVWLLCAVSLAVLPAQAQSTQICFQEVPDCIDGRFAEYWRENGGLPVFGFPIGSATQQQIGGASYLVQSFERNRFELHPENPRPYDVLLGRLGDDRLRHLGRPWEAAPKASNSSQPGCIFFAETGQLLCDQFLQYWRSNGLNLDGQAGVTQAESLALFGLPLTGAAIETGSDGQPYLTQWFERARFELHPEIGSNVVLLGLLGRETSLPASPVPTPTPAPVTPACPALPPAVRASVTPSCLRGGDIFSITANGFTDSEMVRFAVTGPDGVSFPLPVIAGDATVPRSGEYRLRAALSTAAVPGVYTVTLIGRESNVTATVSLGIVPADPNGPPVFDNSLLPPPFSSAPGVGVTIEPPSSPRPGRHLIQGYGFEPLTYVGVYVTTADGQVVGARFQVPVDNAGRTSNNLYYLTDRSDPVGVFALTFESADRSRRAIVYFRVTQ